MFQPFSLLLILSSLSLLLLLLPSHINSACTESGISGLITQTNTFLSDLSGKTESDVDDHVTTTLSSTAYSDCLSTMNQVIESKINYYVDMKTDECRETNTSAPAYAENPCCNLHLMEQDCCIPRTMTETQNLVQRFKEPSTVTAQCNAKDWSNTRRHIRHHFRVNAKKQQVCQKHKERRLRELELLFNNLKSCPQKIMQETECRTNSECFTNKCTPKSESEPTTYTCEPASHSLDQDTALAKCMLSYLPAGDARTLQEKLGISVTEAASYTTLRDALATSVGSNSCVDENVYSNFKPRSRIVSAYTSESTCTGVQLCSDGAASCSDSSYFCGAFCGSNGVCNQTLPSFTNGPDCLSDKNAIGTCRAGAQFHKSHGFRELMNRADCSNDNPYCTVECNGCTEQSCQEEQGFCFGFPYELFKSGSRTQAKCVLPYTISNSGYHFKSCPTGTTDIQFGCLSDDGSSACQSKGGNFFSPPTSQTSCEKSSQNEDVTEREQLLLTCDIGNNRYTAKYKDQCTKCGYTNQLLYRWVMGSYGQGIWTQQSAWVQREMKSLYRWAPTLDTSKYDTLMNNLEATLKSNVWKSYAECALMPTLKNIREVACSCEGTDNCFDSINFCEMGRFPAYPGAQQKHDFKELSVTVNPDSVKEAATVQVSKVPVIIENDRVDFSSSVRSFDIVQNGEVVGRVAGHGASLSVESESGFELCVKIDPQFNTTQFDGPKFGVKNSDGSFSVDSDVKVVTNGEVGVVCGLVRHKDHVYYPILVKTDKFHEDVYSTASQIVTPMSIMIVLVSAILTLIMSM